jgi:hypothetical protein
MSQVRQRSRRTRIDVECRGNQLDRVGELALLDPQGSEQLQGVEIGRRSSQDIAIRALRIRELAALMQPDGALQLARDVGRRRIWWEGHAKLLLKSSAADWSAPGRTPQP